MSRISVPGLIDLLRVDDSAAIEELAADARIDRRYERRGPLINRIVFGRIRDVLQLDGEPLPPVAPRGAVRPAAAQAALEARLDALLAAGGDLGIGSAAIDPLVAFVRGEGRAGNAGPIAQQAVGTLFDPDYVADHDSWSAARVLGAAPSNLNPLRLLIWGLFRRVERARALLAGKVGGDPSGLHATGVAIHNVVSGLVEMRKVYASATRHQQSTAAVVARCIIPPTQVVRQATEAGSAGAGKFTASTLILLRLKKANAASPGYDTAFMDGMWSACPARRWIPALFARVWEKAIGGALP
jgi:hypothetical protein